MAYDKDSNIVALTRKQIEEYINEGCSICPFCKSTNISGDHLDPDGTMFAYRNISCHDCGASWTERFEVESIS